VEFCERIRSIKYAVVASVLTIVFSASAQAWIVAYLPASCSVGKYILLLACSFN
jgi:hypothetical protein